MSDENIDFRRSIQDEIDENNADVSEEEDSIDHLFKNKRYERMEKKRIKEEAKAQKKKEKEEKKNPSSSSKTKISLPDWLTK